MTADEIRKALDSDPERTADMISQGLGLLACHGGYVSPEERDKQFLMWGPPSPHGG